MNRNIDGDCPRILVIDDNPATHQAFRKIFGRGSSSAKALAASEEARFGAHRSCPTHPAFQSTPTTRRSIPAKCSDMRIDS